MVKSSSQPRKVIQVETSYGIVNKVPVMDWKEFISFWPNICRAIFEVLLENDFQPYTATLRRPKGFVAYGGYWKMSNKNPKRVPLSDARYFIYKLLEKPCFTNSIRQFNQNKQKDWLTERNIAILGGYLYSFYYTLRPVLKIVKKENGSYLKPKIALKPQKT
jgi:hypothetical protein